MRERKIKKTRYKETTTNKSSFYFVFLPFFLSSRFLSSIFLYYNLKSKIWKQRRQYVFFLPILHHNYSLSFSLPHLNISIFFIFFYNFKRKIWKRRRHHATLLLYFTLIPFIYLTIYQLASLISPLSLLSTLLHISLPVILAIYVFFLEFFHFYSILILHYSVES